MEKTTTTLSKETDLLRTLAESDSDFGDVLMLSRTGAREILADRRLEILDYLKENQPESIRGLARDLDRDKGDVSRALSTLAQHDVIEYEGGGKGTAKRPRLKHDTILIEPLA